ncbi:MAG: ArsR family transcriptional regulator [Clostridiales Family XIII bacterium]|jgi:ArsR family transcriptional regulator|nr:ArsR family transcriptional regulator [Clostridiales Family XIII bacterium]
MRIRTEDFTDAVLSEEDLLDTAKVSDALAHPARILMFRHILSQNTSGKTVIGKDLVSLTGYSQATVSQHLSKLVTSGLVQRKQVGTSTSYFAHVGVLSTYIDSIKKIGIKP